MCAELGGELMRRRLMMAMGMEEEEMASFKLVDTVTITPREKQKNIDLSTYGCEEFLLHGNIPKTSNTTLFRIGIGGMNNISPRNNNDVYAVEMIAHVHIINGIAMGFVGFESGWSNGNAIGALVSSPRAETKTLLNLTFYPYVSGDEKAVIEIYGR